MSAYREKFVVSSGLLENTAVALHRYFRQYDGKLNVLDFRVDLTSPDNFIDTVEVYHKKVGLATGAISDDDLSRLTQSMDDPRGLNASKRGEVQKLRREFNQARYELSLEGRLDKPVYRGLSGRDMLLLQLGCTVGLETRTPEDVRLQQAIRRHFLLSEVVADYASASMEKKAYSPADVLEAVVEIGNLGPEANSFFEHFDVIKEGIGVLMGRPKDRVKPSRRRAYKFTLSDWQEVMQLTAGHLVVARIGGDPEMYLKGKLGLIPAPVAAT